ncbi:unnamed protein product [marine sediment metagenome]|uniref:Uncharacterized protein n=1 Tax=marine sediment metagenome TaxID=412755 RepID=X0RK71_9ZZZZ
MQRGFVFVVLVLCLDAIVVAACRSAGRVPSTTMLTSGEATTPTNDDAVIRIATNRCERELVCNKIGQGRAFEDQASCLERMDEMMDQEVGRGVCPRGVDAFAVSSCLLEIERTECGGALERTTNLPVCTKAFLCVP